MALSNVKEVSLGGGMRMIYGDYVHTVGAAADTVAVASGKVYGCQVNPQSTSEIVDARGDLYSVSTTGAITTVTIHCVGGIAAGTFHILVGN